MRGTQPVEHAPKRWTALMKAWSEWLTSLCSLCKNHSMTCLPSSVAALSPPRARRSFNSRPFLPKHNHIIHHVRRIPVDCSSCLFCECSAPPCRRTDSTQLRNLTRQRKTERMNVWQLPLRSYRLFSFSFSWNFFEIKETPMLHLLIKDFG